MKLQTKLGAFTIIQSQPADDGDAAVYEVRAAVRKELEHLLEVSGLRSEIAATADREAAFRAKVTQRDVFDIMSALAETIDYEKF